MQKVLFIISFLLVSQCIEAQNQFQSILKTNVRPYSENIRIAFTDAQNNETFLPITVVRGKKEGPIFTIVAGVHGFEYPPIVATQKLLGEINKDSLAGTLIIIPIANVGSFYSRTPFKNPQDNVNLNNAFPGKVDGSVTEKIAHFITANVIPASDVFLDIHGGDANEDLISFICYYNNANRPEQTKRAKELSETSGFEYVVSYPYTITDTEPAKYVFKQAVQDGKIALSIECGKLGNVQKEAVGLIKNGVYNMLKQMKMYNNVTKPNPNLVRLNHQVYIKSKE
jgi:predicted deacylase